MPDADRARYGLCAECLHARRLRSAKGSEFLLCERAAEDPAFPRYPRLPVLKCRGLDRGPADRGNS